MQLYIQPGKYVAAVSGGVDSMVLLDMLAHMPGVEIIVAHFEHGIREDSDLDHKLVQQAAEQYKVPFVSARGNLGSSASEAQAREARYDFLEQVRQTHHAQAIITAHHQDDLIETAILNMLRGTGRKGLSSLSSHDYLLRPMLHATKQAILEYARAHAIAWHEDSTNQSDRYLRNYIRRHYMKDLDTGTRAMLVSYIDHANQANPIIDTLLLDELSVHTKDGALNKYWFIMLPHAVACEIMAAWLRQKDIRDFDRKRIEQLVVAAKTDQPRKRRDVNAGYWLEVGKENLKLASRTAS